MHVPLPAGYGLFVVAAAVRGPNDTPLIVSHTGLIAASDTGSATLTLSGVDADHRLRIYAFGFRSTALAAVLGIPAATLPAAVTVVTAPAGDSPFPARDPDGNLVSEDFSPPDARGGLDVTLIVTTAGSADEEDAFAVALQLQAIVSGVTPDSGVDAGGGTDAGNPGNDAGTDAGTDAGPTPSICPVPDLFMVVAVTDDELDGGSPATVAAAGGPADLSLREALTIANNNGGNKQIWFDPAVFPPGNPTTIAVGSGPVGALPLPSLTSGSTCVLGGGGVVLSGAPLALGAGVGSGLRVFSAGNVIAGLTVVAFPEHGIVIDGGAANGNLVTDCDVGHVDGAPNGNFEDGIRIAAGAWANTIGPANVVGGNAGDGIALAGSGTDLNDIVGNWVGIRPLSLTAIANGNSGIRVHFDASFNTIGGANPADANLIGFSGSSGIQFAGPDTHDNVVVGNYIGTDQQFLVSWVNGAHGILVGDGVHDMTIGPGNHIGFNTGSGIFVGGLTAPGPQAITITGNLVSLNMGSAISLATPSVNGGIAAPVIASADPSFISGTAPPGASVELFGDTSDEARCVLATGISTIAGAWSVPTPAMGCGGFLTASATDAAGNTSELSAPVPFP